MKKILLLPPMLLPIPAVGGGAIEQLITNLLEENEKQGRVQFVVVSKYDSNAARVQWKNSKVYYLDEEKNFRPKEIYLRSLWKLYCLWRKIFCNRIAVKLFRFRTVDMDRYMFLCKWIATVNRVNAVCFEGRWDEAKYDFFNHMVGKENVYTHIHCERAENKRVRQVVNNSISISKYVRDVWVKDVEIPGNNVVVYNCADIDGFSQGIEATEREFLRAAYGVQPNDFLLLFCGRIIPEKGIKELLDAMRLLRDEPIKLLMIGNVGFSADSSSVFEEEMKRVADMLPAVIRTGYIPNKQLRKLYAIADAQVIPSIWQEGAGLVCIEGMAAGLPLVITNSGGMVEYADESAALRVEISERLSEEIAEKVRLLARNAKKCAEMSAAGKKLAQKYCRKSYYDEYVRIFLE